MHKKYLVAPGPTPVAHEVLLEMAKPILHHRTDQFKQIFKKALEELKWIFQTKQDVLMLSGSGTAAMEAAVCNTLSPGDKVITIEGGKFGERWSEISRAYGLEVVAKEVEWGTTIGAKEVKQLLDEHKDAKAVMTQATETSTAVSFPIKEIAEVVSKTDAILIVDGITGVGVDDIKFDDWKIDVLVGGSQKAMMMPPGAAYIALSEKAWKMNETSKCPKYYLDLAKERKNAGKNTTSYTTNVTQVTGFLKAMEIVREDGLDKWFKKNAILAEATRQAAKAMGLEVFAKMNPANSVTAISLPDSIDGGKLPGLLRDTYGVTAAGGQAQLKGKIFRIGHLGYIGPSDMIVTLQRVEWALKDLGYDVEFGKGMGAAQEVFYKNKELFQA
jgi:aspartate aminotransferase-like enzyme